MLTVAYVEEVVMNRIGGMVAQAREITGDASKPSILESTAWAMRRMGYTTATVTEATDSELEGVATAHVDVILDLTELRTLRSIPGNMPAADIVQGPMQTKLSGLLGAVEAMIKRRSDEVAADHAAIMPGTSGGRRRARVIYP